MTGWLLEHQVQVQFYSWLGAFAVAAVWESFEPRRALATPTAARWSRNLILACAGALVGRLCLPLSTVAFAVLAQQRGWGLLNQFSLPVWLACTLGVLAVDLETYALHRLFHSVPILWRCHKVHHADLDVDCTTAFCHHPIEYLAMAGAGLAIVAIIGVPPVAVLVGATLEFVITVFNHGNIAIPQGIDRVLRAVIVTPDMHRVHHSMIEAESNRNFSGFFPWWDHLFSTYQSAPRLGHQRMDLGLAEARTVEEVSFWRLLAVPFRAAVMAVKA